MKYCLVWQATGDEFLVDSIDEELSQWYAEQAIRNNSKYAKSMFQTDFETNDILQLIEDSNKDLDTINAILVKCKLPLLIKPNWFNQWELNKLHKQWVGIQLSNLKFDSMLYKIDPELFNAYSRINRRLHQIENSFKFHLRDINLWRTKNPFEGKTYPTGVFNVSIAYTDHGRNSMEKFINFDEDPNDEELGSWKTIGGSLVINLVKPYEKPYPQEFLNYCKQHSIPVQDMFVPFGNLVDCRNNLTTVREIMTRNYYIPDNYMSIEVL